MRPEPGLQILKRILRATGLVQRMHRVTALLYVRYNLLGGAMTQVKGRRCWSGKIQGRARAHRRYAERLAGKGSLGRVRFAARGGAAKAARKRTPPHTDLAVIVRVRFPAMVQLPFLAHSGLEAFLGRPNRRIRMLHDGLWNSLADTCFGR
jgi:hypothetical protein